MSTFNEIEMITPYGDTDNVLELNIDSSSDAYVLQDVIKLSSTYTFSIWYRTESDSQITFNILGEAEVVDSSIMWKKYVKTITIETLDDASIYIIPSVGINSYFYEGYLVEGISDTSWLPAPEDFEDNIGSVRSEFTQTVNSIIATISASDGKITSLSTTIEGISAEISDAKGSSSTLKTRLEGMEATVTDKEKNLQSQITQNADDIKLKVSEEEMNSAIEVKANEINLSVSKKQDVHLMSIRYIRDWLNGNSIDTNNYFVECKIFNGETNIAKGILPTLKDQLGTPVEQPANLNIYTDDDFNIEVDEGEKDFIDGGTGLKYLELDLGESMKNIDSIQVWHYYLDDRNYNHKLEVSDNGTDWITLFDSSVQSGYEEKSDGRIYYISESSISSQFSKFDVDFDKIKGQITDTNNIIADLKLSTEGFETSITNHEKQLEDFKNDVNEQIKDIVTDAELDTKLSVELGKINTLIKETQGDLTKLSETIQTSDGWKALFAQIGMYDMPEVVTSVLLSSIGITVTNELTGTKTKMTTDGFSGWYNPTPQDGTDGTRVFALDKDVAITSRLYVDNGIDCNTIKILPQKYNNKGAIVFVKTGGSS